MYTKTFEKNKQKLYSINVLKDFLENARVNRILEVDTTIKYKKPRDILKKSKHYEGDNSNGVYVWKSLDKNIDLYTGKSGIKRDSSIGGRTEHHVRSIHHAIKGTCASSRESSGPKFLAFMRENNLIKATFEIRYLDMTTHPIGSELFYEEQLIEILKTPINDEYNNVPAATKKKPLKNNLDEFMN